MEERKNAIIEDDQESDDESGSEKDANKEKRIKNI
jgi:hypothetical protein